MCMSWERMDHNRRPCRIRMFGQSTRLLALPQQSFPDWVAQAIEVYFLTILEARSPRSRCRQGGFFWGLSPWLVVDGCLFLCLRVVFPSAPICVLISSSYKDTSHISLGPNHMTSFYLSYLFKGPVSKIQSHSEELGGEDCNIWILEDTVQPIMSSKTVEIP